MKKIYLPFAILTLALVSCSTTTSQISSSIETSSSPTSTPISSTSSESPIVSSEPNLDSTASNPTSSDISSESTSSSPTSSIDSPLTWDDKTDTFIRRCLDGQTLPAFDIGLDLSLLGGQSQLIITTTQEGNYDDVVLPVLDTLQEAGFVDNTDNYVDLAEGEHILKGRFNDVNIQIDLALAGNVLTQANNYTPTSYSTTTGYLYLFANSQVVITSFPEDDLKIYSQYYLGLTNIMLAPDSTNITEYEIQLYQGILSNYALGLICYTSLDTTPEDEALNYMNLLIDNSYNYDSESGIFITPTSDGIIYIIADTNSFTICLEAIPSNI